MGQGDAALYQGPCGELGLIDANAGATDEVLGALDSAGSRTLKWVSTSHYDYDHIGAIVPIATSPRVSVANAYDRGGDRNAKDTNAYRAYYDWATSGATQRVAVDIGNEFSLCAGDERVRFRVVSAGTDGTAAGGVAVSEENDRGVCLKITYGRFDLATCGDVNGTDASSRTDVESAVASAYGDIEVAKVNHHGSKYSSNTTYVSTLKAQAAIISAGRNSYGHPDANVVARWDEMGDVFQTQNPDGSIRDGNVSIVADAAGPFFLTTNLGGRRTYSLDP